MFASPFVKQGDMVGEPEVPKRLDSLDQSELERLSTESLRRHLEEVGIAQDFQEEVCEAAQKGQYDTALGRSREGFKLGKGSGVILSPSISQSALMEHGFRVVEECAEIVLLHSSLTVNRITYFDSLRLRHFLDSKGVRYVVIDANKEFSQAVGAVNDRLIQCWKGLDLLYMDPVDCDRPLMPQVLLDGVAIGSLREVEDYEEDQDLDWCLARKQCPACFHPRELGDEECSSCGSKYQQLINKELIDSRHVLVVQRGRNIGEDG